MTENEIVQYLKENKNKGVMYIFMPEEVKDWCFYKDHRSDFLLYKPGHGWAKVSDDFVLAAGYVIALPEEFKLKEKPEGGWIECGINNKTDCFFFEDGHYYHWSEWNTCLTQNHDWVKAFGGWQYEEKGVWYTSPQLSLVDDPKGEYHIGIYADGEEAEKVKPLIPIKIRFWREKK